MKGPAPLDRWNLAANRRRLLLTVLILLPTIAATGYMADILPHKGTTPLELAMVVVFAALWAWISIGFWASVMGLAMLLRRHDRFDASHLPLDSLPMPVLQAAGARTAVLLPVASEDMDRVSAGLAATYRSAERAGALPLLDFFILSDTQDPDLWVEEEAAWERLVRELGADGKLFYRRRRVNLKRKSGNVADFCRRWGRSYRYMIVFDADSVMSGETLLALVRIMELRPKAGIVQTAPAPVNRETLLARVTQFAGRLYGPMFAAGLHFWQLGDSQFWGHNAIIRIEPFMRHCSLPRLPGPPPLGGDILSHDFVEAALMRRAGWEVWLAYSLPGSWEETPPTLLNELKRDRRWAQGNMQHLRLLFTKGLFPAHRALFLNGFMSYFSAFLWFLFLVLSTAEAVYEAVRQPVYFPRDRSLFPDWPVWHPQWAYTLLATTAVILFLPKLLSILLALVRGRSRGFGGILRLTASVLAETVTSSLLAPIRMLFHSKFVFLTFLGRSIGWGTQQRGDLSTSWAEAVRFHGPGTLLGLAWAIVLSLITPSFFWWNTPIFVPLILSSPLSVLTSRADLGRAARRAGLFLIPEEVAPPVELRGLDETRPPASPLALGPGQGFAQAAADPRINGLHTALLGRDRRLSATEAARRDAIMDKSLAHGPDGLTKAEKKALLYDPARMRLLHRRIWELEDRDRARPWGLT